MAREKPILMSTEMVQAYFAGLKTQTRRIIKPQPHMEGNDFIYRGSPKYFAQMRDEFCPYGRPNDKLWVRETFCDVTSLDSDVSEFKYKADPQTENWRWKPGIHMPRKACRIVFPILNIIVERVQEISPGDAMEEGMPDKLLRSYPPHERSGAAKKWYAELWDKINGKTFPWASNPWVWAIEFPRYKK